MHDWGGEKERNTNKNRNIKISGNFVKHRKGQRMNKKRKEKKIMKLRKEKLRAWKSNTINMHIWYLENKLKKETIMPGNLTDTIMAVKANNILLVIIYQQVSPFLIPDSTWRCLINSLTTVASLPAVYKSSTLPN